MLFRKLVSSLKPAALATAFVFGFEPALLALAQTEGEPTLNVSAARGTASGAWVPATLGTPGSMHGSMVDERGHKRFEISAVTHRIVPSEIPGYDAGSLYGRLLSPRLQDDPITDLKGQETKVAVEPASIYVVGHWSVRQSDGAGRFWGVAYVDFAPLPVPLVLLDIGGSFQLPQPMAESPKSDEIIGKPLREVLPQKFVVCYAHPDLFRSALRLARQAELADVAERTLPLGNLQTTASSGAVRFHARWKTRD